MKQIYVLRFKICFSSFILNFEFFFSQILLQPLIYNRQLFGSKFLIKLSSAYNYWLNIPHDKLKIIDESVLMLRDNGIL